jgi:hypothetical protein
MLAHKDRSDGCHTDNTVFSVMHGETQLFWFLIFCISLALAFKNTRISAGQQTLWHLETRTSSTELKGKNFRFTHSLSSKILIKLKFVVSVWMSKIA